MILFPSGAVGKPSGACRCRVVTYSSRLTGGVATSARQGFVKTAAPSAKEPSRLSSSVSRWRMTRRTAHPGLASVLEPRMPDVVFVGLIVLFFAALVLLVKGLERL